MGRQRFASLLISIGIGFSVLLTACSVSAPAASPTSAPKAQSTTAPVSAPTEKPASAAAAKPVTSAPEQLEWEKTLAAAKQEGVLNLLTQPGTDYKRMVDQFQAKYPEIKVEHTASRPSDISPKIITEQQNGQYVWDVFTAQTSNMVNVLTPAGVLQEIRSFITMPDVTDDSKWLGGFEFWAHDVSKQPLILVFAADVIGGYAVNRDSVAKDQVTSVDDLLDPKWAGKIVIDDPSVPANGSITLAGFMHARGEEFVKRFFTESKPVVQETVRVTTEWLVTGRYPIAVGADKNFFQEFQKEGIGKNVDFMQGPRYLATRGVSVFKHAPHPNATKVWVNWLLSQEGQKAYVEAFQGNSRRNDVPVLNLNELPDFSKLETYASPNQESGKDLVAKVIALYKSTR
ncbi:MAG: extracellular solute-binding protein [Chloroflexota bacterium]